MASSQTQPAPATQATNPQPQTTVKPASISFVQHSFPGNGPMYTTGFSGAGGGFGSTVTTALVPVSGYFRRFRITLNATGGAGNTTGAAGNKDAPWNAIQQVIVKDASGNVNIINLPGYEALKLLPMICGSFNWNRYLDPACAPYYSGIQTTTGSGNGDFQFQSFLPLEFGGEGVGSIGGDNASVLPTIFWNTNTTTTVFATAPATLPTLNIQVDADYWWNPDQPDLVPDGLGSSRQYQLLTGTPTVSNNSSALVTLPKFGGGFIDSITLEMRDTAGARTDTAWPSRLQLYIDNVSYINEDLNQIIFDMYNVLQLEGGNATTASDPYYNGAATTDVIGGRPVGVLHFSFRNGVNQADLGLEQSGLNYVSTTPGTNIQIGGTGWRNQQSDSNTPYTLYAIIGLVVPAGNLITT
jgi:hypothetical protein